MIEIIKELSVEVTKPNIFQALVAKQYDMNTRFLKVTLMDCGTRIDVPYIETAKVVINAERKDGQSKGFDGVINEDGTVTVPLHSWMLELEGTVICDISVMDTAIDNNKKLTTTSFTLIVEKAAYGGDDITSDPQYDVLVSLLEAASTAQEALDVSNQALEKSAEANEKYDACVEATENANKVREEIEAGGYIESLKEMNNGGKFSFWVGTSEEYEQLEEKISGCLYILTDEISLTELSAQIDDFKTQIEAISEQTTKNTKNITSIERTVDEHEKELNLIGDDIAEFWGVAGNAKVPMNPLEKDYKVFLVRCGNATTFAFANGIYSDIDGYYEYINGDLRNRLHISIKRTKHPTYTGAEQWTNKSTVTAYTKSANDDNPMSTDSVTVDEIYGVI